MHLKSGHKLKFEFCQLSWSRITDKLNLQLTGKISLKFDFSSSLRLEYGRLNPARSE